MIRPLFGRRFEYNVGGVVSGVDESSASPLQVFDGGVVRVYFRCGGATDYEDFHFLSVSGSLCARAVC